MRNVSHLKVALARQRYRQGRALVLCSVTVEGVMRGIAVLENHADRNACIDKADRGEMSGNEFVRLFVLKKYVCREVCEERIHNERSVFVQRCVCVYLRKETRMSMSACMLRVWRTEGVSVSESNMTICVPGWRLWELSSM